MNKTWSIILIVVASIVVLGGTYWYFGMQKQKPQEETTPIAVVEPAKTQPPVAKASAVVAPSPKTEPPVTKAVAEPKEKPAVEPIQPEKAKAVGKNLPADTPKPVKQLAAPVAPSITKNGGFSLPSFDDASIAAEAEKEPQTLVLASEELPPKAKASTPAAFEDTRVASETEKGPQTLVLASMELPPEAEVKALPTIEEKRPEPVVQDEGLVVAGVDSQEVQGDENPESLQTEPVEIQPEVPAATAVVPTPPSVKILKSETATIEEKAADDKPKLDASLSVSFRDYNFPKDFSTSEKSFSVSVDVMSQKEMFGWGGTLEVGRYNTSGIVQISLLGKAEWKLGKGVVTFPLSVSLGPTIFINSTNNPTEFGMKAKLSAGVSYAISESFRMFYAVGVGATYNFTDSTSLRFVLEPIRVGIGFSF